MGTRIGRLVLAALVSVGCATVPDDPPVDEQCASIAQSCAQICGLAVVAVVAIPCIVAAGAGWIAGACTRCGEGPPDDPADPAATAVVHVPAAAVVTTGMRY